MVTSIRVTSCLGGEDGNVFLIDIPDFSQNTAEVRNHRYSPENIDGSSSNQRDNLCGAADVQRVAWD
jgi:hypothetical protein